MGGGGAQRPFGVFMSLKRGMCTHGCARKAQLVKILLESTGNWYKFEEEKLHRFSYN
jgi:hypothetical protein